MPSVGRGLGLEHLSRAPAARPFVTVFQVPADQSARARGPAYSRSRRYAA